MTLLTDKLTSIFNKQWKFMELLKEHDKIPEWPVDLHTKHGQRIVKECMFNLMEELHEASHILKNKVHRITDDSDVDYNHYKEELGDAFAFFIELFIMSGITPDVVYDEYVRKNNIVKKRFNEGY